MEYLLVLFIVSLVIARLHWWLGRKWSSYLWITTLVSLVLFIGSLFFVNYSHCLLSSSRTSLFYADTVAIVQINFVVCFVVFLGRALERWTDSQIVHRVTYTMLLIIAVFLLALFLLYEAFAIGFGSEGCSNGIYSTGEKTVELQL